jgi:hypothetical protein
MMIFKFLSLNWNLKTKIYTYYVRFPFFFRFFAVLSTRYITCTTIVFPHCKTLKSLYTLVNAKPEREREQNSKEKKGSDIQRIAHSHTTAKSCTDDADRATTTCRTTRFFISFFFRDTIISYTRIMLCYRYIIM